MGRAGQELRKAGSVFVKSIKDSYGYLGTVLMNSIMWFAWAVIVVMGASLFTRSPWVVAGLALVGTAPATAAASYVVFLVLKREDIGIRDFIVGFRRFGVRALGLMAAELLLIAVLLADIVFCFTNKNPVIKAVGGIWIYALLFVLMMMNYLIPLVVQQDTGTGKALKRSALLILDNPFFSILMSFFNLLVAVVCIVIAPAFALLFMGILSFLQGNGAVEVLKKYNIHTVPEEEPYTPDILDTPEIPGIPEESSTGERSFNEEEKGV
ncbi:MAG: DUF624 domain-containing protein [Firmicutes bacterium]|nr:DUF624 domain-containing protein [Bacillota bacterium]